MLSIIIKVSNHMIELGEMLEISRNEHFMGWYHRCDAWHSDFIIDVVYFLSIKYYVFFSQPSI